MSTSNHLNIEYQKPPSFLRSEKAFINALYIELKDKKFDKIHVVDILKRSEYTRGAFYSKYYDKYCFIETIVHKLVALHVWHLMQYYIYRENHASVNELLVLSEHLFKFVYDNRLLYNMIIDQQLPSINVDTFCDEMTKLQITNNIYSSNIPEECNKELFYYISCRDSLTFIQYWKKKNYSIPANYMAQQSLLFIREEFFNFPKEGKYIK